MFGFKDRVSETLHSLRKLAGSSAKAPRIVRMIRTYEKRLSYWSNLPPLSVSGEKIIGILVCPWLETAVPLFSIELGFVLASEGFNVTLIWDPGEPFGEECRPQEKRALEKLLSKVSRILKVASPPELARPVDPRWMTNSERIVRNNAIARKKGEDAASAYYEENLRIVPKVAIHFSAIESLFEKNDFQWIMVPGGVYSTSAMYRDVSSAFGAGCTTFDSDAGMLMFCNNGVATHHTDIPEACRLLFKDLREIPQAKCTMHRMVEDELQARCQGTDFWNFQKIPSQGSSAIPCDVLVPLNLRWDTAALDRELAFSSVKEWLATLSDWARKNSGVHVCVRQHPCERHEYARGTDDMAEWIAALGASVPNLHFIKADDQVSTYDLLRSTRVVVPHTSTIVLEAALRRIPSVLASRVYYEDHGFTWSCRNQSEFTARLEEALSGQLLISDDKHEKAEIIFFLTQLCAVLRTKFTPIPGDFEVWSLESPSELLARTELSDVVFSLKHRIPLSYLRALRLLGLEQKLESIRRGFPADR
ncbi:MAG: hypothetical protein WC003_15075 [Terrimicrobiaceae bacterium]